MDREPLLFERYPLLRGKIPWIALGDFPTPIERMGGLGEHLGHERLFVKRDDLSGEVYGGNKVRKLEFALADALDKKLESVMTIGAVGSNHVLATTIYARQLGLETIGIFVPQPVQENLRTNILCNCHHGCEIEYVDSQEMAAFRVLGVYGRELLRRGQRPYLLWVGGSSVLGTLGYVECALELAAQVEAGLIAEPDFIFAPVGSSGTFAGLMVGLKLAGLKTIPVGVRVADYPFANEAVVAYLARRVSSFLRSQDPSVPAVKIKMADVTMLHDYFGPGYAHYTTKAVEAVELGKELEGFKLEGTYSGKTLAAFIDFMSPRARKDATAIFINTYNSRPLDDLMFECPGAEILPGEVRTGYFDTEIAPVAL